MTAVNKMFTSKPNTMTGKLDWEVLDEEYDYQQELARAGFADMLHDYERVFKLKIASNIENLL
jgi:hypothetical protein